MAVSARYMVAAAVLAFGVVALGAGTAAANCGGCNGQPPTVRPPSPPTPPPSCQGSRSGCGGGVKVVVPPVNIPSPTVNVTFGSSSMVIANQTASVSVSGGGGFFLGGGGGIVGDVDPGVSGGMLPMLAASREVVTREIKGLRAIQASCIDDGNAQHDASQTFGDANVSPDFTGEIYRCMAGSKMRVLVGSVENGKANFNGARSFDCAKGEALVYEGHQVVCRVQEQKRPCNERSLLRRFGPGVKVVTLRETQTVAQEQRQMVSQGAMQIGFDGGVGQSVW